MKKNVASKIIAGALATTMVLGMAACGDDSSNASGSASGSSSSSSQQASNSGSSSATPAPEVTPEPEDRTPLSITVSLPSDETHTDANEWYDKLVAEINEYTDMNVTWQWQAQATYYDAEHLGLWISTGNVPDVMVVGKDATFLNAAESGLFWDLTDYLKDYDNLASISEVALENASYNGKVYGVPRSRTVARNGLGYRVDWLNNLGLKEPTTWENFTAMLYAFTYNDPDGNGVDDTVGLALDSWTGVFNIMETWFGVPNEWGIDAKGDLVHKSQTEEYKTALKAFRELYSQGVINNGANGIPDFMDVTAGKARDQLLRTGLAGCGVQVLDDQRKVETYFEDLGLSTDEENIYTLQGYVDTGLGALCYPTTGMNNMIAISTVNIKTEQQLRRVLLFLNELCDGECMNLIEYGWEGLTYSINENGYVVDFTADELTASGVGSKNYSNGFNQIIPYWTAEENARPVSRESGTTTITRLEQKLYAENVQYCVPNYGAGYTSDTYVAQGAALDTILSESLISYIKGEIDDAGLEAALTQWWTAGGETVTKEMNALYHAAGN